MVRKERMVSQVSESNLDEIIVNGEKIAFEERPIFWLWAHTMHLKKEVFHLQHRIEQLELALKQAERKPKKKRLNLNYATSEIPNSEI